MTDKPISGDALEDDFYEDDLVAASASEEEEEEAEQQTTTTPSKTSKKRKAKKEKAKRKRARQDPFNDIVHIFKSDPATQCAYVHDRQRLALSKLSNIELDEQMLPEAQFVNNDNFKQSEHTLDTLPNYVKFGVMRHSKLIKAPEAKATPMVLVLTHAAVRAADLARALKPLQSETHKIAKLFAKHLKVEEQVDFLNRQPIHIGVGTPNRIKLLVEQGHLKLDALELVVVDTEKNAKQFNVFENDAVRGDLYSFLGTYVAPRAQEKQTKIALF
ncbi:hypothetical protein RO3G_03958 [Lichtheimia corymbifera JMRC:FSU:9682]|uniref:Protein CMS1 n=1 Tax=Lichtheimia corymbifera JMRC:FSU:9682 TaxID=1263082 RepID=A0A068RKN5_9FUNG|nr:hypothetical protein RO3G_03958 [Lichtheimia corymbifera JMRC:FSU:9682]